MHLATKELMQDQEKYPDTVQKKIDEVYTKYQKEIKKSPINIALMHQYRNFAPLRKAHFNHVHKRNTRAMRKYIETVHQISKDNHDNVPIT